MVVVLFYCATISVLDILFWEQTMNEQLFTDIQKLLQSGDVEAMINIVRTLDCDDIADCLFTVHDTALSHANVQTVSESAAAGYELGLLDAIDTYNILSLYIVMM
jgi:hypothetical protein